MCFRYVEANVLGHNLLDFVGGDVQGILMNPPWRIPHKPKVPGQIEPEDLVRHFMNSLFCCINMCLCYSYTGSTVPDNVAVAHALVS